MSDADSPTDDRAGDLQIEYDWTTTSPSTAVIEAVATATDSEPEALETLNEYVDTDALDALFQRDSGKRSDSTLSISFTYDGVAVTVGASGVVVESSGQ